MVNNNEWYEYQVDMTEVCRNRYMLYAHNDEEALHKAVHGKTYFDGIQDIIGDSEDVTIVSKKLIRKEKEDEPK